ncbi:winged helix-turn-helix domain-containing protein [Shewanella sp. 3B26]|uniref:Winged helix-turn-helix domain-containing protein n=1 Tax=Shewanella zhuhaiensis TaxID=2919576 RepID=A0AAJ1BKR1_9GAMM|nr:winged helix-turn-helix domain-containing protein [Shewanella zhuhaiensis]MCH4295607.1 winged helix-turn-helix domain-containing protein [Shewanella zhuhaiensis]
MPDIYINSANEPTILQSRGIQLNTQSRQVSIDGEAVNINGLSYRLLEVFLLNAAKPLPTKQLARLVWNKEFVSDETLAQRVSLLRKALGETGRDAIEAERGVGYIWLGEVTSASAEAPTSPSAAPKPPGAAPKPPGAADAALPPPVYTQTATKGEKRYWPVVIAAALMCALALLAWVSWQSATSDSGAGNGKVSNNQEAADLPVLLRKAGQFANQHTAAGNLLAIELYRQFLANAADKQQAQIGLCKALLERVAKFDGKAELLDEAASLITALKQNPQPDAEILWLEGYHQDVLGNINRAIASYEQALAKPSKLQSRIAGSLAYLYTQKGRLYESINLNLSALAGNSPYKYLQIAEVLYLADAPRAYEWIGLAYSLAPNDNFTSLLYARSLMVNNQSAKALAAIEKLHALDTATADSLLLQSLIAMQAEDWQRAMALLDSAISKDSNSATALALRYWLLKTEPGADTQLAGMPPKPQINPSPDGWPNLFIAQSLLDIADGHNQAAIEALDQAAGLGYLDHKFIASLPPFKGLIQTGKLQKVLDHMADLSARERTKIGLISLPDPNQLLQAAQ